MSAASESIFSKVKTSVFFFVAWQVLHFVFNTSNAIAFGEV